MTRGTVKRSLQGTGVVMTLAAVTDGAADYGERLTALVLLLWLVRCLLRRPSAERPAEPVAAPSEPPAAPVRHLTLVPDLPAEPEPEEESPEEAADTEAAMREAAERESEPTERLVVPDDSDDQDQDQAEPEPEPQRKPRKRATTGRHADMMRDYYEARQVWQDTRDAYSKGYETEGEEFDELYPPPRLADFMTDYATRYAEPEPERV